MRTRWSSATRKGFPFIPGKTLKGLLRDAAISISKLESGPSESDPFIHEVFGWQTDINSPDSDAGKCHFTNAALSEDAAKFILEKSHEKKNYLEYLFQRRSTTAIDSLGQAKEHSLRRIETVVPLSLFASILDVPKEFEPPLEQCFKWIKRIGVNRNRGLGRCGLSILKKESTP